MFTTKVKINVQFAVNTNVKTRYFSRLLLIIKVHMLMNANYHIVHVVQIKSVCLNYSTVEYTMT